MSKAEDFGETITGSRWFNREPKTREIPVKTVKVTWPCPMDSCDGEMNGINILDRPRCDMIPLQIESLNGEHGCCVWSLWDIMNSFPFFRWLFIHAELRDLKTRFGTSVHEGKGQRKIDDTDLKLVVPVLKETDRFCKLIGFTKASQTITISLLRLRRNPPEFDRSAFANELQHIIDALVSESHEHRFIQIRPDRAQYFGVSHPFGESVSTAFPNATDDICAAADCLAVECNTAAVFHLMRVAEYGLRALAYDRRVKVPRNRPLELATWEDIIRELEKAETAIQNYPKTLPREAQYVFYHGAMMEFRAFKNKFRNRLMHARESAYDRDEAHSAFERVRSFMQILSERISEGKRTPKIWKGVKWSTPAHS